MTTQQTMTAMVLTGHGGLDKLEYHDDWPLPIINADEVLVKVHACGLNNTDVNTRTGWYSKAVTGATTGAALADAKEVDATWGEQALQFPRIQGADVVGTVVECGVNTDRSLLGRRVLIDTWLRDWNEPNNSESYGYYGSEIDGGFGEYTKVDYRQVHPLESDLSDAELATFATAYVTAENMLNRAVVTAGDSVLIPGASGGVGSALIQLANRRSARTVAMCSEDKFSAVQALQPSAILPRAPKDLAAALREQLGQENVTVVADVVGGPQWSRLLEVLVRGGRYTCAGAIAGPIVEFDLRTFYLRDLTFTGATVVPVGVFADLVSYLERGELQPVLAATLPLSQLRQAQQLFIDKNHVGNIVVTP